MGCVFSSLSTVCIYAGEFLQEVCLAIGEISAVLVRAFFGLIVVLCDIFAAVSCCWRVPWSERPDRSAYTYDTQVLADVGGKKVLSGAFTKEGREQRKQIKLAKKKEQQLQAEELAAKKAEEKELKAKEKADKAAADSKAKEEKAAADVKAKEEKAAAAQKAKDDKAAAQAAAKAEKEATAATKA